MRLAPPASLPALRLQVRPEFRDIVLPDLAGRHEDELIRRDHRAIPLGELLQHLDRLVAVHVGILHHRAVHGAVLYPLERGVGLVEADHLDQLQLARPTEGLQDQGRVVGEEPHHPVHVGVARQGVLGVGLGLGPVEIVRQGPEDGEAVALDRLSRRIEAGRVLGAVEQFVDHPLAAQPGVVLLHPADQNHDLAAVGQRLLDQPAAHPPGDVVVHPDEDLALGLGRVGVMGDQGGPLRDPVEQFDLVGRVDRAHRDAGDASGDEVFQHVLLLRSAVGRHQHRDLRPEVLPSLLGAGLGDVPKGIHPVGHVGELAALASGRAGPASTVRRAAPAAAGGQEERHAGRQRQPGKRQGNAGGTHGRGIGLVGVGGNRRGGFREGATLGESATREKPKNGTAPVARQAPPRHPPGYQSPTLPSR